MTTSTIRRSIAVLALGLATAAGAGHLAQADPTTPATSNLVPEDAYLRHGFASATQFDEFSDARDTAAVPECGGDDVAQAKHVTGAEKRLVRGAHTTAVEEIVAFDNAEHARDYVMAFESRLDGCDVTAAGMDNAWKTRGHLLFDTPKAERAEAWYVNATLPNDDPDAEDGPSHHALTIAQVGNRVVLLRLSSTTSKPWQTIDLPGLVDDAAGRAR